MLTKPGVPLFNLGNNNHNDNIITTTNHNYQQQFLSFSLAKMVLQIQGTKLCIVGPTASSLVDSLTHFVTLGGWPLHSITDSSLS